MPVCLSYTTLQGDIKSPLEYIQESEPIKVSGAVVASYGSEWRIVVIGGTSGDDELCDGTLAASNRSSSVASTAATLTRGVALLQ